MWQKKTVPSMPMPKTKPPVMPAMPTPNPIVPTEKSGTKTPRHNPMKSGYHKL